MSFITKVRTNEPVTVSKWQNFRSGGFIGEGVFSHNVVNRGTYERGDFPAESRGATSLC